MKITFLGSGSAFSLDNYHSNMLIEVEDKNLLFDCGGDIRWSLKEVGKTMMDIQAVYISHDHADHCGGLEGISFSQYFGRVVKGGVKPVLFGNAEVLQNLWEHSLSGGMSCIQMKQATLDTFFDVRAIPSSPFDFDKYTVIAKMEPIKLNQFQCLGDYSFKLVQSVHVVADTMIKKSYGLMFSYDDEDIKKIFITSDTQWAPSQLRDFIASSEVTFHDCETVPYQYASGVHAHYEELKLLPAELKKKMWLYHWNGSYDKLPDAVADGFAGFVKKGQVFEF